MATDAANFAAVRDRERGRCQLCTFGEHELGSAPQWRLVIHPIGGGALALLHDGCRRWLDAHPQQARALGLLAEADPTKAAG